MKRIFLIVATAILLANTVALPTAARADNGSGQCPNGSMCKP